MARTEESWTEGQARIELRALEQSGESLHEYAARTGVSTRRLAYWRSRLTDGAPPHQVPRLVELAVRPGARPLGVEVCFPAGHVVRLKGDVSLIAVLRAVAGLAC